MVSTSEKAEWFGVTEVVNKVAQGLYRANATTAVVAAFVLISYGLLSSVSGDGTLLNLPPAGQILTFLFVLAITYAITFLFGYIGVGGAQSASYLFPSIGYIAINATSNTDYAGTTETVTGTPAPGTFIYDMTVGRLEVGPSGIAGIVNVPWNQVLSVSLLTEQVVRLKRIHKEFGITVGRINIDLHFLTQQDADQFFVAISKSHKR